MHGTPCFAGTRVPVKSLFDHLEGGYTIDYFLSQFPTVSREQVLAVLVLWRENAEASAVLVGEQPPQQDPSAAIRGFAPPGGIDLPFPPREPIRPTPNSET